MLPTLERIGPDLTSSKENSLPPAGIVSTRLHRVMQCLLAVLDSGISLVVSMGVICTRELPIIDVGLSTPTMYA